MKVYPTDYGNIHKQEKKEVKWEGVGELDVLLDKWIVDGVFKPNQVSRESIEEEQRDLRFCQLHNYMQHATARMLGAPLTGSPQNQGGDPQVDPTRSSEESAP